MGTLVPTFIAIDPTVAASTGTQDYGGGLIASGTPTIYSKHSQPGDGMFSDVITITSSSGPLTGTAIVQVSNSNDVLELAGTGKWITYSAISLSWTSGSADLGYEVISPAFRRYRLKIVIASGTGNIKVERTIKGK